MELSSFHNPSSPAPRPSDARRARGGFTLLELLIVIAIIGILASVLVPNLLAARAAAKERSAQAHARNVYTVGVAYISENARNTVIVGDCTSGYTAGDYSISEPPRSAVETCTVTDADSDGLPEVSVSASSGLVINYP